MHVCVRWKSSSPPVTLYCSTYSSRERCGVVSNSLEIRSDTLNTALTLFSSSASRETHMCAASAHIFSPEVHIFIVLLCAGIISCFTNIVFPFTSARRDSRNWLLAARIKLTPLSLAWWMTCENKKQAVFCFSHADFMAALCIAMQLGKCVQRTVFKEPDFFQILGPQKHCGSVKRWENLKDMQNA